MTAFAVEHPLIVVGFAVGLIVFGLLGLLWDELSHRPDDQTNAAPEGEAPWYAMGDASPLEVEMHRRGEL